MKLNSFRVEYTTQKFMASNGTEVSIDPTFNKIHINVNYLSKKDGLTHTSNVSIPMNNISDFITELKKLEREYKSYKIVDDMCKELSKELG